MSNHEATEQHVSKSTGHNDASHNCMTQVQELWNNGAKSASNLVKDITNGASHIDIPNIFENVKSTVAHAGEQAWTGMDKDPNLHFIKHDICNDEPLKVGVAAVSAVGIGAVALALVAPEAMAAAAISETAVGIAGIGAVFGATGLKMDYDNRHPKH